MSVPKQTLRNALLVNIKLNLGIENVYVYVLYMII